VAIPDTLQLTGEEQAMLRGDHGPAVRRAIEIVVALGRIYGASHLVPITSVQVAGVSYKNLGEAGLAFLREWAAKGARVRVPTTLNPAGLDLQRWKELGFSLAFAQRQQHVIDAYAAMGVTPTCTCTPYLVGNRPQPGDHIAWAESSAVSFANSVLGARTNREGGPSALAAAICGRTAAYGLHLEENRRAQCVVEVQCPLRTISDWSALGYVVGRRVQNQVPYICLCHGGGNAGLTESVQARYSLLDCLKSLGAAMAASGAVALYYVEGRTPGADPAVIVPKPTIIAVHDLDEGYAELDAACGSDQLDLVSIGCPHASVDEIREIADMVKGRRVRTALWVTTAAQTRARAAPEVAHIEAAGGRVVADTCMVVAPVREVGFRCMATNSAKMAFYTPSHSGLGVRFGSLETCIKAALAGRWLEAGSAPQRQVRSC